MEKRNVIGCTADGGGRISGVWGSIRLKFPEKFSPGGGSEDRFVAGRRRHFNGAFVMALFEAEAHQRGRLIQ